MERRKTKRIPMEVPVSVGEMSGMSRDISSNGIYIYFTSEGAFQVGGDIVFSLTLEHALPNEPVQLNCQGHVVRIEDLGERKGIAAQIDRHCYLH